MNAGNFKFSKTFYRVATVPAFLISAMLTYLLVEYSIHGAKALEADVEMKALAALVAVVLAVSQLAGSTYASLLSGQSLTLRCFGLRTLAYFICAVEFCTSVGMQLSTTLGADMVQTQVSTREESLKERIKKFEDSAREKKDGALKQEAAACKIKDGGKQVCGAWELSLAAKQRQGATADTDKAEALQAELKAVQAQKAPTFVSSVGQAGGILGFEFDAGKAFAVMLIVARMLGLCAGALLFSELAGALLHRGWPSFRAPASPAPKAASAPVSANAPTTPDQVYPATPDRVQQAPQATPAPTFDFGFIPRQPANARHGADDASEVWRAPRREYFLAPEPAPAPAPAPAPVPAPAPAPTTPDRVYPATPDQVYPATPAPVELKKKAPQVRLRKAPAPAGARADTGVVGDVAGRYTRIKEAVAAGRCVPSLNKMREFLSAAGEGCNQDVARNYLGQLAKEGVIEPKASSKGWQLKDAA